MKYLLILAVLLFASAAIVRAEPPSIDSGLLMVSGQPATLATTAPLLSSLNISGTMTFSANTLNASIGTLSATLTPPGSGCSGCTYSQVTSGTIGTVSCATDAADFTVASGGAVTTSTAAGTSLNAGTYGLCYQVAASGAITLQGSTSLTATSGLSAPAAALAGCQTANGGGPTNGSCFDHLAFSMDFTGATQSGYEGGTQFDARTLSNWLTNAPGSSSGCPSSANIMFNFGYAGEAPPACSIYTIVSDSGGGGGGATALYQDWVNSAHSTRAAVLATSQYLTAATDQGTVFPQGFYIEIRMRSPSAFDPTWPDVDIWSYGGYSNVPPSEWDFIEVYSGGGGYGTCQGGRVSGQSCSSQQLVFTPTTYPSWNIANYQTIGVRLTQNGTTAIWCSYVNNTQVACQTGSTMTSSSVLGGDPLNILIQNGTFQTSGETSELYVQWLRVWDCTNWRQANYPTVNANACMGVALSTNP
jgi:hypothetical protein